MNLKQNYFELFDLPESCQSEGECLSEKYKLMQQSVHPDKYVQASEQDKRLSLQYTVFINEAYQTLINPVLRAIYLLKLSAIDISTNQNAPVDPEFLMLQIEFHESLEEIDTGGSSEDDMKRLDELKAKIDSLSKTLQTEFETAYLQNNLREAEQSVYKMQFTDKLLSAILRVEEKLLDY